MIKSSDSKSLLILEIFTVLIVSLFLTTLLTPSFGNSETGTNATPSFNVNSIHPLSYNVNFSNVLKEKVIYTLVLSNNTLINGNVIGKVNGAAPFDVTYDANNRYVYVAVQKGASCNVSVINGTTNEVIENTTVGIRPLGISVDSSNGYVYVTNCGSNDVSVINGTTNKVVKSITVGSSPNGISFDSNNGNFYVANDCSNNVSVINGTTNKVVKSIRVGLYPEGVSFDPNNGNIYVSNDKSNNVSVINGTTNKVVNSITVGSFPKDISVDSTNGNVYVDNWCSESVSVINGTTNKVVKSITVGRSPNGISFDSNNENFYVANDCSNNVSVINGTTNKVVKNITVGSSPKGVSVNSNNGYVYVTNHCSNNISVINGTTNKVVKSITVGSYPNGVSFDSENGYVYVANTFTSSISIIGVMTYKVTFSESGLPTGDLWYVNLSNGAVSGAIYAGSSFTFDLTNGSYNYNIATNDKIYHANAGSFPVNGAALTESVSFSLYTYQVTFNDSGLQIGINWYVNLSNGMKSGAITGTTYYFSLTNGTYNYTISTSNKTYKPTSPSGSITVYGRNSSQSVSFSPFTYQVTFSESGLPSGDLWYVNLSNGAVSGAIDAGSTFTFDLTNGSYNYNIATNNKIYHANAGSFPVNGAALTESVSFSPFTYQVTFSESGLPSGDLWYVNITGQPSSGAITGSSFTIDLTNETYSYTVNNVSGYSVMPSSGSILVNGAGISKTVTFTNIKKPISSPGLSNAGLYSIAGGVSAVAAIGSVAVLMIRRRK